MHIINAFLELTSITHNHVNQWLGTNDEDGANATQGVEEGNSNPNNTTGQSLTDHYNEFTHSWEAFWLCLGHGVCYYTAAILGYSFFFEHWPIEDSAYFATVMFTTVGYGDLSPSNKNSQIFTMCLVLYGIIILGIFIGILGDIIVENQNSTLQSRLKDANNKVLDSLARTHEENVLGSGLTPLQVQSSNTNNSVGDNEPDQRTGLLRSRNSNQGTKETSVLRDIWTIVVLEAPSVAVILVLGLVLGWFEGWTSLESIYFVVITGTTVGLGDITPHTRSVRLLSVLFLPFAVAVLGEVLARIAASYMDRKRKKTDKEFLSKSLTFSDIQTMDNNKDGAVDRAEFVIYMLVALQRVDKEDVDEITQCFNRLDRTKSDTLTINDLTSNGWNENFQASLVEAANLKAEKASAGRASAPAPL